MRGDVEAGLAVCLVAPSGPAFDPALYSTMTLAAGHGRSWLVVALREPLDIIAHGDGSCFKTIILCGFDMTDIPTDEIAEGDWTELLGKAIPVDNVARAGGTIGYEFLTGLGQLYARRHVS